jgi:hypothetical protein
MCLGIWDVEHGACATVMYRLNGRLGPLAMIDCGDASDWRPSKYIRHGLGRSRVDYLFIANAEQDHLSDLDGFGKQALGLRWFIEIPIRRRQC